MSRIIILIVNAILIILLIASITSDSNDKSTIVFIFGYVVILGLNLFLWMILGLFKSKLENEMGKIMIGLAIAFFPAYVYVSVFT
jgi:hypothetical protein